MQSSPRDRRARQGILLQGQKNPAPAQRKIRPLNTKAIQYRSDRSCMALFISYPKAPPTAPFCPRGCFLPRPAASIFRLSDCSPPQFRGRLSPFRDCLSAVRAVLSRFQASVSVHAALRPAHAAALNGTASALSELHSGLIYVSQKRPQPVHNEAASRG